MLKLEFFSQKISLGLNYLSKIYKVNSNPQWFDTVFNNQWISIAQEVAKNSAVFDNYCYVKNINSSILHKINNHTLVFLGLENLETGGGS